MVQRDSVSLPRNFDFISGSWIWTYTFADHLSETLASLEPTILRRGPFASGPKVVSATLHEVGTQVLDVCLTYQLHLAQR